MDGPDAQAIARVDDALIDDPRLIQERAVHAVEILDGEAAILKLEQAMAPAYFRRRDAQIAVPASADDGRLMAQLDFPTSSRTFIDNQLHVHGRYRINSKNQFPRTNFRKQGLADEFWDLVLVLGSLSADSLQA